MEVKDFSKRVTELRMNRGVSARDMSLSLGYSPSYINNLEIGACLPSMTTFFYICEYLNITPSEFFDTDSHDPIREKKLLEVVRSLNVEQIDLLTNIAEEFDKGNKLRHKR